MNREEILAASEEVGKDFSVLMGKVSDLIAEHDPRSHEQAMTRFQEALFWTLQGLQKRGSSQ